MPRTNPRSTALVLAAAVLATLVAAAPALAGFCVGINCGPRQLSEVSHCHSVDVRGNQCWDEQDDTCEQVPGFRAADGAVPCSGAVGGGPAGTVGTQIATVFAGYDQFRTGVVRPSVARIAADAGLAATEEQSESGGGFHFSQIVASAEQEQWELFGLEGETNGLRLGWDRQTESGVLVGIAGSYQEADPDVGASSELIHVQGSVGHTLGEVWRWSASLEWSDLSGLADVQLYGAGAQLSFAKGLDNGHVFSGGLIGRFTTSDDDAYDDDLSTLGAGLAYGFPIGSRLTWDFDGYAVHAFDSGLADDTFFLVGTQLGIYFTPSFALHLGYRILEGIDDLDSDTVTVGFAGRWE